MGKPKTAFQIYLDSLETKPEPPTLHPVIAMDDNQESGFLNFNYRTAMESNNTKTPTTRAETQQEDPGVEVDPKDDSSAMASASTSQGDPDKVKAVPVPVVKAPAQPPVKSQTPVPPSAPKT